MSAQTVTLIAANGAATVRITIGHANFGKFGIYVFEPDKLTHSTIANGRTPPGQQSFPLPAALHGRFLAWDVYVAPYTKKGGEAYHVTMEVLQNGLPLTSFVSEGVFSSGNPKLIRANAAIVAV